MSAPQPLHSPPIPAPAPASFPRLASDAPRAGNPSKRGTIPAAAFRLAIITGVGLTAYCLGMAAVAAAAGLPQRAAGASAPVDRQNLKIFMRQQMGEAWSPISIAVLHAPDEGPDAESMAGLGEPTAALQKAAGHLKTHAPPAMKAEDIVVFHEQSAALDESIRAFAAALKDRKAKALPGIAMQIDNACQACHARLAPNAGH